MIRSALLDATAGLRVGILGLMEAEWLDTLVAVDGAELCYTDFVGAATAGAAALRAAGADVVIALTHMRRPNDERLADGAVGVDLILGGHDHSIAYTPPCARGVVVSAAAAGGGAAEEDTIGAWSGAARQRPAIVKSGTDFRHLSALVLAIDRSTVPATVAIEAPPTVYEVTRAFPPNSAVEAIVCHYVTAATAAARGGAPGKGRNGAGALAYLSAPADASFATLRTAPSAVGSLLADILAASAPGGGADVALLNAGTLRSDTVHPAGAFSGADLDALLPFSDQLVSFPVRGADLVEALEVGVGALPAAEGRFPLVSGIRFAYDPQRPPGQRVDKASVWVRRRCDSTTEGSRRGAGDGDGSVRGGGGKGGGVPFAPDARGGWAPLDPTASYALATKTFLSSGADGYGGLAAAHLRALDAGWPTAVPRDTPSLRAVVAAFFAALAAEAAARAAGEDDDRGARGGAEPDGGWSGGGACLAALMDEVLRRGAEAGTAVAPSRAGGRAVATGDGSGCGGGSDGSASFCISPVRSAVGAPLPVLGLIDDGRVVDVAAAASIP